MTAIRCLGAAILLAALLGIATANTGGDDGFEWGLSATTSTALANH